MNVAQELVWSDSFESIDWDELSALYRAAPLGNESAAWLQQAFGNSRYCCFARAGGALVAAGRVLADGVDCAYVCDIAVLPSHAVPGKEDFYRRFGFRRMKTAMAIFEDPRQAYERGYLDEP